MTKERTIMIEASPPQDFEITYWYSKAHAMPENEAEHVKEMIEDGLVEGELNDNGNHGGWRSAQ